MKNIIMTIVMGIVVIVIAVVSFNMGMNHGIEQYQENEHERIESMEIGESYTRTPLDSDMSWEIVRTR